MIADEYVVQQLVGHGSLVVNKYNVVGLKNLCGKDYFFVFLLSTKRTRCFTKTMLKRVCQKK